MYTIDSIPEHQASEDIAILYADIKRTLGASAVNLLWRHLATIDGALASTWKAVRPLYISGVAEQHAAQLRNVRHLPSLQPWSENQLRNVGVSKLDTETLRAVVANYDRTNAPNLVSLMGLLGTLSDRPPSSPPVPTDRQPRYADSNARPLPPLIDPDEMSPRVEQLGLALNNLGIERKSHQIFAGVPRHLANWPELLALIVDSCVPFESAIERCITEVQHEASARGAILRPIIDAHLDEPIGTQAAGALRQFSAPELIANYIVKIAMLRTLIPT